MGIITTGNIPVEKEIILGKTAIKEAVLTPKKYTAKKRVALTIEPVITCCSKSGAKYAIKNKERDKNNSFVNIFCKTIVLLLIFLFFFFTKKYFICFVIFIKLCVTNF